MVAGKEGGGRGRRGGWHAKRVPLVINIMIG